MINAVVGLGFMALFLGIAWLYDRVLLPRLRNWWYPPSQWTIQEYRTGGPVMSSHTVTLAPGEKIVKRCTHQQAESVVLSTGETVAAVCTSCLGPLSPRYIADQRAKAERIAYCEHDNLIDVTRFGSAEMEYTCGGCGEWTAGH